VKWQGPEPTLTKEQAAFAQLVGKMRRELPTFADLAKAWGVPARTVQNYGNRLPKRYR
jgi:hypothetical protein